MIREYKPDRRIGAAFVWTGDSLRTGTTALSIALFGTLALAGCAREPKGPVIAIVDGQEITIDELRAELTNIPIPADIDRKLLRQTLLQQMIDRKVMAQRARKEGIDKTPDYIARRQRGLEDILAAMLGHNVAQQVPLPEEREIEQYIAAHPAQFAQRQQLRFDQIRFDPPKDRSKLDVLKDAHSIDAAAAALQSVGIASVRGSSTFDTGTADPALVDNIKQVPPGEPMLLPQGNQLAVGVITAALPNIAPPEAQKLTAARALRAAALLRESQAQIARLRGTAKIAYEPGFAPDKPAGR